MSKPSPVPLFSESKIPYLVTTALPYANNHLHLGHILEQIQADIWVRHLKLQGHPVLFVSGVDAHGTAIMLQAEKEHKPAELMVEAFRQSHQEDAKAFGVAFDIYDSTHCPSAEAKVQSIYCTLKERGWITESVVEQLYDDERQMFLPDRMVRGDCPRCNASDQYGDVCEACGATYESSELCNPRSTLSNATPKLQSSNHYFFDLPQCQNFLTQWIGQDLDLHPAVRAKLSEWLKLGLKPWDISRDAPYFGFLIPPSDNKYFYVWLDAPVGYMAAAQSAIDSGSAPSSFQGWRWDNEDHPVKIYHFVGKDIIYFHGLFWPAMLHAAHRPLPTGLCVHGHLTLEGQKMSKSRGNFMFAKHFRSLMPPESLRYYFASRLQSNIEDIDLCLKDLATKFNSDVIHKWLNLASRSAKILEHHFGGNLSDSSFSKGLVEEGWLVLEEVQQLLYQRDYAQAIRNLMRLADRANQRFDELKPWMLVQNSDQKEEAQKACSEAIHIFALLALGLKPILPELVAASEVWLGFDLNWTDLRKIRSGWVLKPYFPLAVRIDEKDLSKLE